MRPLNILDFSLIFLTFNSYLKQIELLLGELFNKYYLYNYTPITFFVKSLIDHLPERN